MLNQHLIVKTFPKANEENVVLWKNYRVTVLADKLFRIERNAKRKFRDEATQSVWFRNMPKQSFNADMGGAELIIKTESCELKITEKREDCRIRLKGGKWQRMDDSGNLKGTYRTLDCCDGGMHIKLPWDSRPTGDIELETGVCSKNGVAVFDDANSLTLGEDGEIKPETGVGSDEYVFAYGNDYRSAVQALYKITGNVPLVPRYALGNWWSRYYVYTQEEYLRLLNRFEERKVPLSVATIDMDWHYSTEMESDLHIEELGRNTSFYGGNSGWTGYSWNKRLFPDYKKLLKDIKKRDLKITLNLHPAEGVRWWEDQYEEMANAIGRDATTLELIPFDIANTDFINAYFSVLHKPYEEDGVAFWWIDWQQGTNSAIAGLDPLWSLNHYHYLDNAVNHSKPLILSRYARIGSHRYPVGFSGDTFITWKTLDYLPYFTSTATNVGYVWWSHDIGGHMFGEKNDELYVRHVQYGVFSPINRLHSSNAATVTKEPWFYKNGTGLIAQEFLRFRHKLIPYLYTASEKTAREGVALVEPLYYHYDCANAYKYDREYFFGGNLLVAPVLKKIQKDGYARQKAWIPEGEWIDIFTGERYYAPVGGMEKTLLRTLDTIPVLIRAGGILPLSLTEGNCVDNPEFLEVDAWEGDGEYILYEDGRERENTNEVRTFFKNERVAENGRVTQTLTIFSKGMDGVIPKNRKLRVCFKDVLPTAEIAVYKDGAKLSLEKTIADCATIEFGFEKDSEYKVVAVFDELNEWQKRQKTILQVFLEAESELETKGDFYNELRKAETLEEYLTCVDSAKVSEGIKLKLKEIV